MNYHKLEKTWTIKKYNSDRLCQLDTSFHDVSRVIGVADSLGNKYY